jgi:hypothetical protein
LQPLPKSIEAGLCIEIALGLPCQHADPPHPFTLTISWSPLFPHEQTFAGTHRTAAPCHHRTLVGPRMSFEIGP